MGSKMERSPLPAPALEDCDWDTPSVVPLQELFLAPLFEWYGYASFVPVIGNINLMRFGSAPEPLSHMVC